MGLVSELRRRNVLRMVVLYVVAAWLIMQVAEVVIGLADLPGWIGKAILWLLAVGFPIALIFSWCYEITPEGISLEKDVRPGESITHVTGRRLDFLVISLLCAAVILFAYDKWWIGPPPDASIAVLPFVNMSDDASNEYFSDGLSEELLNLLAKVPELRVTSRSSAFAFKGQEIDISDVAQKLNVAHILEGSVRKSGNQLRITAQLIEARTDTHLWSETWDRTLVDIFGIQDEIAAEVVSKLKVTMLGTRPTAAVTDPDAYALYLQAKHFAGLATAESMDKAVGLYKQVLDTDPIYANAWNGLSRVYINQAGRSLPWGEGLRLAREAAIEALSLDSEISDVHRNLGWIAIYDEGDLEAAARHFERAISLPPSDLSELSDAATMFQVLTRFDEAIAIREYLVARNPVKASYFYNHGTALHFANRLDDAIASYRTALTLSPSMSDASLNIGIALLLKGDPDATLVVLQDDPENDWSLAVMSMAYHALGRVAESEAVLAQLIESTDDSEILRAYVHAYRRESDQAFSLLNAEYERNGKGGFFNVAGDPLLISLHADPRWVPFLERIGRSPEQLAAINFEVTLPD